ncbi:MAG TPA: hypothetical protein VNT58_08870 [Gaiellaceae bacterium]|nr:hypothetical protein [Gaiellaceae bacterium]
MSATAAARETTLAAGKARTRLSVCCMTSGRRPALLGGVLSALRAVADEVVVAVEHPRAEAVAEAVAGVADVVLSFPPNPPADRPISWLFASCSGEWIFNVDDDEVPSPALVAVLPRLVERQDITHAWIARRWLYPTPATYLASRPWGTEFQLRLVRTDDRFLQFSDEFHRPVICHGPTAYVPEPLWHLDAVLNPAAHRRAKAAAYESERPGMRIDGLAHNHALYVPELSEGARVVDVPPEDARAIGSALAYVPAPAAPPPLVRRSRADVDAHWVGSPLRRAAGGTVELLGEVQPFVAGAQATVDVRITNRSGRRWRWGRDARPPVRLGYRWFRAGECVVEPAALRTTLPHDLPAGEAQVVPVHVVAPTEPGRYTLELDLLVEPDDWFRCGAAAEVEVRPRAGVALVGTSDAVAATVVALDLEPATEVVVLLRDAADAADYGDYAKVVGLRPYLLLGNDGDARAATLLRLAWRTAWIALTGRAAEWQAPRYRELLALRGRTDLVVAGPNWEEGAAFGREWYVVVATALLWRLAGREVVIPDQVLPRGARSVAVAARAALRLLRTRA